MNAPELKLFKQKKEDNEYINFQSHFRYFLMHFTFTFNG